MEEIVWHRRESRRKQRTQTSSCNQGRLLSTRMKRDNARSTTHPAAGGIRGTEITEKCSTEKGYYGVRSSGDSVPDTHRRFAWCGQCPYPAGMRVIGYGRLPISDQGLHPAF